MGNLLSSLVKDFDRPSLLPERVLTSESLAGVAAYIREKKPTKVVVMCGAGISVNAGIPDFRTPGTGLYDNLQKYNLPDPQAIFDIQYFRRKPSAFYALAAEMWPGARYKPTKTHQFIALLHAKGVLRRCFTQNIDSLESAAGLPAEKLVQAHGSFDSARCIETGKDVPINELRDAVITGEAGEHGWAAFNVRHGGLCKPDIVFFGESLPQKFALAPGDLGACDLLLVLGTSLKVQPFASLVGMPQPHVPRLVINRENLLPLDRGHGGAPELDRHLGVDDAEGNGRDVQFEGDCDVGCAELARLLGWEVELEALCRGGAAPPEGDASREVPSSS
mmetsp:Transcript_52287/g.144823  ORF Transcript_52287/g.144823 Transcript_52287/m.144823 type:complete len:334 (-) Transcript_52287:73-1074(-)